MLKLMLPVHALLISGTLSPDTLALHSVILSQAKSLQFLDLSQNMLDKKSIDHIVAGLETPPQTGCCLDDCSLLSPALEFL